MTRHLGVSVFLSVAIVVFFAIVLYQPEQPPAPTAERSAPTTSEPTTPVATVHREEMAHAPHPSPGALRPAAQATTPAQKKYASLRAGARTARRKATAPALEPGERVAFIHADAGETVADVAVRVYGSPDAAGALWMANRDILPSRDARLSAGTVLRTP